MSPPFAIDAPVFRDLALALLARGATVRARLRGWSMSPFVRDGSAVRIAPADGGRVRPGDLLLVDSGGELMVHRLVARRRRQGALWLVTRGDANPRRDAPVPASAVHGRVVAVGRVSLEGATGRLLNGAATVAARFVPAARQAWSAWRRRRAS